MVINSGGGGIYLRSYHPFLFSTHLKFQSNFLYSDNGRLGIQMYYCKKIATVFIF